MPNLRSEASKDKTGEAAGPSENKDWSLQVRVSETDGRDEGEAEVRERGSELAYRWDVRAGAKDRERGIMSLKHAEA